MIKKSLIFFFCFLFFFLIPPAFYFLNSQPEVLNQDEIEYNLPYPGILPDNPLFFLKKIRDNILEWTTRDSIKKAQLYLLFSDKRAAMALALIKNGKDKHAAIAFTQGEQYFLKIPTLVDTSRKQGVSAPSEFIQQLKLSNTKHKEIGQMFLKDLPQGQNEAVNKALDLNEEIRKKIENL